MSLRALTHFLFERAGFNRWSPVMAGKRSQGVLHKYLLRAAEQVRAKGVALGERLYVPEQFNEVESSIRHRALCGARGVDTVIGRLAAAGCVFGEPPVRWVPNALSHELLSGGIPTGCAAHLTQLLDEAPVPLLVMAVEEAAAKEGVRPRLPWRSLGILSSTLPARVSQVRSR